MSKHLKIGISGVTCGGKTTIARRLSDYLNNGKRITKVFNQDDYFKEENEIEKDSKGFVMWDCAQAVNFDQLCTDVNLEVQTESDETRTQLCKVVVVEGNLIFADENLNNMLDVRIFLDLDYTVTEERRKKRVYDPPDTPGLFQHHVWPSFLNYRQFVLTNSEKFSCMAWLDASQDMELIFNKVLKHVHDYIS